MRILAFSAGPAGMYCGSCIRDNALAAELLRQGHDVTLIPLYTPTLTDEDNVSQHRIFFGGISVYLEQYVPLFRHTPWLLDRLWDSPWLLNLMTKLAISNNPGQLGAMTVSMLRGANGYQNKEIKKLLGWLGTQPKPDVVNLPYSLLINLAAPLKEVLGCPITCTLQGEDIFLDGLEDPYRSESLELIRSHVADVNAFIAVSQYYADFNTDYLGIPPEKIHVVPLGINLEGYGKKEKREHQPFTVGYFARITPEKGLHTLCETYRDMRLKHDLPRSRLEAAGYLAPEHKDYLKRIQRNMREWGLGGEFHYRGVLNREEKIRFLQGLDVISAPGSYAEPKGLYLLEAMACGVPFVQPRHGAFPEICEKTGGGLLIEPNSREALAEGILSLWKDPSLREELGRNGIKGVRQRFCVSCEANRALEVYNRILGIAPTSKEPAAVANQI